MSSRRERAADIKAFLDTGLRKHEHPSSPSVSCSPLDSPERFKRMCNTPTGNCAKSLQKTSPLRITKGLGKSARKGIIFGDTSQCNNDHEQTTKCESVCVSVTSNNDLTTLASPMPIPVLLDLAQINLIKRKASHFSGTVPMVVQDNFQCLSAEDIKPEGKPKIKVLIPQNGKSSVRTPPDDTTAALVENLCTKKWRSAANCLMKHTELKQEILTVLSKTVSKEVITFCKSLSVLKKSLAEELSSFTSKNIVDKQAIRDHHEMGKKHDIKVIRWKKEIENRKCLLLLLQEIEKNQGQENDVELVLTKATLQKYDGYSEEVFEELIRVLDQVGVKFERDRICRKDILHCRKKSKAKSIQHTGEYSIYFKTDDLCTNYFTV